MPDAVFLKISGAKLELLDFRILHFLLKRSTFDCNNYIFKFNTANPLTHPVGFRLNMIFRSCTADRIWTFHSKCVI